MTRSIRARVAAGRLRHCARQSARTPAPSGSSLTPLTSGPASIRYPSPAGTTYSAKPRMTPGMSLSLSQRETCTTTGSASPSRPSPVTVAARADLTDRPVVAGEPPGGAAGGPPPSTPIVARIARTVPAPSSSFFAENGSMDGGMIRVSAAGIHDGTYCRRVKTKPRAGSR